MACKWRIRHKLMLGLGLVLAIMALLLAGTLKGLSSYRATMRSIDSKLVELMEADKLRAAVKVLADPGANLEVGSLRTRAGEARAALEGYQAKLAETVLQRRDPDGGLQELAQVDALIERFAKLEKALALATAPRVVSLTDPSTRLIDQKAVKDALEDLVRTAGDLNNVIYGDLYDRINASKRDYKVSLALVLTTSVFGVLLLVSLLRFFYTWVFYPIHDLEKGVGRVAQGDFEHKIEIHSGDEIEDLAEAFNDMTARLREMYTDLARQVNERSRQLVRSERLAGLGFLAAGVAHEINNPLATISFCSDSLRGRLSDLHQVEPQDKEIFARYLGMIQEEALRCSKITRRLLEFSRRGEHGREKTDLADVVRGVLDMVQALPVGRGKGISFQAEGGLEASVNRAEIKSVVLNLVVNALESMDAGGQLTITGRRQNGQAFLTFHDTGCGMTGEVLENIFEPFFTTKQVGQGTGLGLSISHRIVTQHGGDIEAASPGPNQGSTFTVRLPVLSVGKDSGNREQESGIRNQESGIRDPESDRGGEEPAPAIQFPRRYAA